MERRERFARIILNGFESYFAEFQNITLGARTRFENADWLGMHAAGTERIDLYTERSPIHHTELLSCPIILLQGLEDKVVLPNQAEVMVDALRNKGLPVAYLPFEGEQHGFRKAENIKRALEAELYFYSRILGFDLVEPVEPVDIENL